MKTKLFALVLALAMLLCALPVSAEETTVPAAPQRAPGYCGEAILWNYENGTLTITGTGKMDDFPEGTPWGEYKDAIHTVVISGGITYIGAHSFSDYDKLTNVEFGQDVYEIGERAFFSCDGLTAVYLPASFRVFGPSSFMGCSKLKEFHCEGKFPSFKMNCLWDTYAVIYFPAARPWGVDLIRDLEEAFHGRIEFLASDGSDPYEPTEATTQTEAPTQAPTTEPTEAPTTVPPTTVPPTETVTEETAEVQTEPQQTSEAATEPELPEPDNAEKSNGVQVAYLIIAGVICFLILGRVLFRGPRKKGRYSR